MRIMKDITQKIRIGLQRAVLLVEQAYGLHVRRMQLSKINQIRSYRRTCLFPPPLNADPHHKAATQAEFSMPNPPEIRIYY